MPLPELHPFLSLFQINNNSTTLKNVSITKLDNTFKLTNTYKHYSSPYKEHTSGFYFGFINTFTLFY